MIMIKMIIKMMMMMMIIIIMIIIMMIMILMMMMIMIMMLKIMMMMVTSINYNERCYIIYSPHVSISTNQRGINTLKKQITNQKLMK
jgi:hypothetical protein